MSNKELKRRLIEGGYTVRTRDTVECDTKIKRAYYVKKGVCVSFLKIGKSRETITILKEWESIVHSAGKLVKYDALAIDVMSTVEALERGEYVEPKEA